jgi:cardiolipin synthase
VLGARRRVWAWSVVLPAVTLVLAASCAHVNTDLTKLPAVELGEPAFYPTLQAYAGAPIVGGNGVQILLNGAEIFPAVVAAIRAARTSITYAQYFFEEGPVCEDVIEAVRACRRISSWTASEP